MALWEPAWVLGLGDYRLHLKYFQQMKGIERTDHYHRPIGKVVVEEEAASGLAWRQVWKRFSLKVLWD